MVIPVSIFIESEPDTYNTTNSPPTENFGCESLQLSFDVWNSFRQNHEKLTHQPANFNWMLRADPSMDALGEPLEQLASRYRKDFDNVLRRGDQLGIHFHPYNWDNERHSWVAELEDKRWLAEMTRQAVARFETAFAFKPEMIRFSDNAYISNWTLNLLEELGIKIDVSLHRFSPAVFIDIPVNGSVDSTAYLNLPDYPYRPDPEDFTRVGEVTHRNIMLIPTSVGSRLLPTPDAALESGYRLKRQYIALDMAYDNEAFREALDDKLRTLHLPHLVIVHNTNVLTDAKFTKFFHENIKTLANHPLAKNFRFYTANELVQKVNFVNAQTFNAYGSDYVNWLRLVANNKTDEYMQLRFNYMLLDNYKNRVEQEWAKKATEVEELRASSAKASSA